MPESVRELDWDMASLHLQSKDYFISLIKAKVNRVEMAIMTLISFNSLFLFVSDSFVLKFFTQDVPSSCFLMPIYIVLLFVKTICTPFLMLQSLLLEGIVFLELILHQNFNIKMLDQFEYVGGHMKTWNVNVYWNLRLLTLPVIVLPEPNSLFYFRTPYFLRFLFQRFVPALIIPQILSLRLPVSVLILLHSRIASFTSNAKITRWACYIA